MWERRERTRILAAVLTLIVVIMGWLATFDQQTRSKFGELALLYTGAMFALLNPANRRDDDASSP